MILLLAALASVPAAADNDPPKSVNELLALAKQCYDGGRYADAGRHLADAYERSSEKKAEHLYFSAAAYLMAKEYPTAIAAFERLRQAHPQAMQPAWKEHWIHALLAGGQGRRAIEPMQARIAETSGAEQVRWQEILIHEYLELKMPTEAAGYLARLTREAPAEARWWKLRGQILLMTGDEAAALAALTIYGYLVPLTEAEQKAWADLSLQVGVPGQAVPVYEALLRQTADPSVLEHLVLALQRLGNYEAALSHVESAAAGRQDPKLLMLRADLLYTLKRYADAAEAYRRAAEQKHPRCGKAWLMAGYAAWQAEDLSSSRQAFSRAAAYEDQRKSALAAMRQLRQIN
jgi:tetratricopeptide (TPR) repeat protein